MLWGLINLLVWGPLCAETCCAAQTGCNLWNSNDMPASASQGAGATHARDCGWQYLKRRPSHNCMKMFPAVLAVISPHWICVEVSSSRGWGNRLWRNPKRPGWQKPVKNRPVSEHSDWWFVFCWVGKESFRTLSTPSFLDQSILKHMCMSTSTCLSLHTSVLTYYNSLCKTHSIILFTLLCNLCYSDSKISWK